MSETAEMRAQIISIRQGTRLTNGPRCRRDKPKSDLAVASLILCAGGRARKVSAFLEQLPEKRVIGLFNK
jgi:hypothetical protein